MCTSGTYTRTLSAQCLGSNGTALGSVCFLTRSYSTLHGKTPSTKTKARVKLLVPEMPTTGEAKKSRPSKGNFPSCLLPLFHSLRCCTMPTGLSPELCNAPSAHVHTNFYARRMPKHPVHPSTFNPEFISISTLCFHFFLSFLKYHDRRNTSAVHSYGIFSEALDIIFFSLG